MLGVNGTIAERIFFIFSVALVMLCIGSTMCIIVIGKLRFSLSLVSAAALNFPFLLQAPW